jgi:hypothetical protein
LSKEDAIRQAKQDLAKRLKISESQVKEKSVENADFPDMSLGAPENGEMSAQIISSGWRISLEANGQKFEYRADPYQLRLYNYKGKNYLIQS